MRNLILVLTVMLVGCGDPEVVVGPVGPKGDQGIPGEPGQSCTVTDIPANDAYPNGGALIECGNDAVVVENGTDGKGLCELLKICRGK